MRKRFAFSLTLLAASLAPALAQTTSSPAVRDLPDLQSAGALGADLFQGSGATGMVLVVVRDHQVFFQGYGETAPGSHQLPGPDSLLRLCSLTKIFTTDLMVKLAKDQTIRLDDPLQRFAPPHAVVPRRIQSITLADLATHTSGLPREIGNAPRGTPHFTYPDYATRWRWLASQHLHSTPGTAALYSNVAFDLLGDALQNAAHKPYAALLAERTMKPLNMRQTTFFPSPVQCAHLLQGVYDEGSCTSTGNTAGSSGLYSTAADMTLWLKYLLGNGGPGSPAQDPAAQADYIPASKLVREQGLDHAGVPTSIGLGWMHLLPTNAPSHIVEKTGGGAGFATYIAISPSRHVALFLAATNGPTGGHVNLFKTANSVLLTLAGLPLLPPEPPKATVTASHRRRSAVARSHSGTN